MPAAFSTAAKSSLLQAGGGGESISLSFARASWTLRRRSTIVAIGGRFLLFSLGARHCRPNGPPGQRRPQAGLDEDTEGIEEVAIEPIRAVTILENRRPSRQVK